MFCKTLPLMNLVHIHFFWIEDEAHMNRCKADTDKWLFSSNNLGGLGDDMVQCPYLDPLKWRLISPPPPPYRIYSEL